MDWLRRAIAAIAALLGGRSDDSDGDDSTDLNRTGQSANLDPTPMNVSGSPDDRDNSSDHHSGDGDGGDDGGGDD
jgi:hypothetical protein